MQPTVLAGVDPAAEVPLGPLVTVTPYDDFGDALSLVERAVARLPAGGIGINRLPAEPPDTPPERIVEFTRPRRVVIR
ncbi:aldehyde dehydrogenase family protein [Amycolatopsis sp. FDAARGOS 1241]|uniref:aldehyde dehydrogenase family protein n=1 Tax=Amycolatopsis sp. FDAARGOS 1241 TaxID=2778070 RepID=UPI001EF23378|nr:aldehyde dehydrogenase family protein [Amycolatopsis sp. FDAARGOS 1241]